VVVATTRPETMLGDAAVAVHPDDDRYRALVGREVMLPLTGRKILIIADHYVDREFGSGCVKITPAHDFNDYDVGTRHQLPMINILHEDASLNDNAPPAYRGLDRYAARDRVIADLTALGLIDKIEPHRMAVPRGEKSGVVVEPFLSDQWFVRTTPLAEPAIKAVEDGDIQFVPKNYENNYFVWMRDIQDWCISRQQWWGHRIPAWYDEAGNVYVARTEAEARARYSLADGLPLHQDDDVLDTWFSSALWTFSTLGWPEKTPELARFHSTDVMVTGHDIITFWVSRMIMMTLKFMGEVPFHTVYVTGLVTDADGQKMAKSKGNGLDPLDIIDGIDLAALIAKRTDSLLQPKMAERIAKATRKEFPDGIAAYGTDALRFTFYAIATRSRNIRFDMNRVEGYRNFCNKLWNAASFVQMNTVDFSFHGDQEQSVVDRWITSELHNTIAAVNTAMETYRFDLAAKAIYEFVWDQFCDWYLELCKPVLYSGNASELQLRGTRATLLRTLETTLRLAHPFLPFMTEEIWQELPTQIRGTGETIMLQAFPEPIEAHRDESAIADVAWLKDVVTGVRNIRGEMNIPFGKPIPVIFNNGNDTDKLRLDEYRELLEFLVKSTTIDWHRTGESIPVSATHLVGEMQVLVPMRGLIDKDAEIARLDKDIDKKQLEVSRTQSKINNPNFVEKAPEEVVQKEKDKLQDLLTALQQLQHQRARVASI
jgi:valyl-tRNA synthetase